MAFWIYYVLCDITAPAPVEHPMNLSAEQVEQTLELPTGSIRKDPRMGKGGMLGRLL